MKLDFTPNLVKYETQNWLINFFLNISFRAPSFEFSGRHERPQGIFDCHSVPLPGRSPLHFNSPHNYFHRDEKKGKRFLRHVTCSSRHQHLEQGTSSWKWSIKSLGKSTGKKWTRKRKYLVNITTSNFGE